MGRRSGHHQDPLLFLMISENRGDRRFGGSSHVDADGHVSGHESGMHSRRTIRVDGEILLLTIRVSLASESAFLSVEYAVGQEYTLRPPPLIH